MPWNHANYLCTYHEADQATVASAIEGALAAKDAWESMPWGDRAAIFLKAAELVSGKYRYKLMAATMLGQGKNAWQAEIDAAAEVRASRLPRVAVGFSESRWVFDLSLMGIGSRVLRLVFLDLVAFGFFEVWSQVC